MRNHISSQPVSWIGAALLAGATATANTGSLLNYSPSIGPGPVMQSAPASKPSAEKSTATEEKPAAPSGMSDRATFLLSHERVHGDPEILWPGFLNGLRGFEHFYDPVGNPLYFESPMNNTQLRLLYLHHSFPNGSMIGGGWVDVYAAQVRIAVTERLGLIATKDGWSDLHAGILPEASGWNDFAIGAKYVIIADRETDFLLTGGMRWEWHNGDRDVLMGRSDELSPFISLGKGFDRLHLLGNLTGRLPMDHNDANYILQWDLHADYEVAPETLPGFAPMIEVHGLHYLSDGNALPLSVGGLDYSNIGSEDVSGDSVIWMGLGFRWKLTPHVSVGSTWEFPLHNPDNDIMDNRVTVDLALTW